MIGNASASSWLGHGDPDDVATRRCQLGNLLQRGVDVRGQGCGHRLDADRRIAADGDLADSDLSTHATRREGRRGKGRQTQVDAHVAFRGEVWQGRSCRG